MQSQKRPADFNPGGEPTYASEFDSLHDNIYGADFDDPNQFPSSSFTFTSNLDGFFDLNAASGEQGAGANFTSSPATAQDGPTPKTEDDALGSTDWTQAATLSSSTSPGSQTTSPGYGNFTSRTSPATEVGTYDANGNLLSSSADSAADMQNLMNLFYSANARTHNSAAGTNTTFTHINPSQVLGGNSANGSSTTLNGEGGQGGDVRGSGSISNYSSPADSPHMAPTPPLAKRALPRPVAVSKASSSTGRKKSISSYQPSIEPPPFSRKSSSHQVNEDDSADLAVSSAVPNGPLVGKKNVKTESKTSPKTPTGSTSEGNTPEGSGSAAPPPARTSGGADAPTICSNCHTTNTPLWRRDPDGNPLCNVNCASSDGKLWPGWR